ncbi:Putative pentatricopeptide repeat-containing protein At5g09950 [Ancistrocladus abbreviatus]
MFVAAAAASPLPPYSTPLDSSTLQTHCANRVIPFAESAHHQKTTLSQNPPLPSPKPAFFSSSGSDLRDFLAFQCQNCCCSDDAKQLHLQILKHGFVGDLFLCNTLINVYFRIGDSASATYMFDEMPDKNAVTWACMISGFTQNGMPEQACDFFRGVFRAGFIPSHYEFGSALRACQELGPDNISLGMQIHGLISKTRFAFDPVVNNVLISMYGNCCLESPYYARRVFDGIHGRNSISWNSIISVYTQTGDIVTVFQLFSAMQQEGSGTSFKPNEYTFGSLLTAASSSPDSDLCLFDQLLTRVHKGGFLGDLYVGSALVSGFAKLGLIASAKKIFEQMTVRNAVSMNGLIVGLVKQKRGEEAAEIFNEMKNLVAVNLDSYAILLSAFTEFEVLDEGCRRGQELHAYVTRMGWTVVKVAIGNGLINMYAKCGAIGYACSVFRLMGARDSISWNSLISGLDQNGCYEEAVAKFSIMRRTGLRSSNFTLISSLSSCASLGWIKMGAQIHCEGLKLGLDFDVSVSNALLGLYAESGCLDECKKLFSLMPGHDQVSWNSLIGALANSEASALEAIAYFLEMMQSRWILNRVTFINILSAISSLSLHEVGRQVHALVLKYCAGDDTAIENALISCYGKFGGMDDCEEIFCRMFDRRDEVSWNSMISGYIHNEQLSKAMDLVWYIMQNGRKLDQFTFATVLSACASIATLEHGMEVHACQIRTCLGYDVVVGSALVDMYAKCGRIDYASTFFGLMPVKNIYSWNSMISGYARHGLVDKALELFVQMKLAGQPPDHVTFVGVLSACSHAGLVEEGYGHFESMNKLYGLVPRMEHFSCMVDLLGRAGNIDKMEDFINKMPIAPNVLIWRTVLGSCARTNGRNAKLGSGAAEMLLKMEPDNAVNYVLLANMYASGGKWEYVAKARFAMRSAAVKKEAGCSWVTMKDGVHVFVAGDKLHPEKDAIYKKLAELQQKMRDAGYVPQTSFAPYDVEQESKEEFLRYHSEKLAVAFVLTRSSVSTIRIMKNLRVCGDCHSAFCYISKIVGRQIVLRDSNRFHHFVDGKCSCGDYW